MKNFKITLVDVLQIIGFILGLYMFLYGLFGFTHDRLVCDYEYNGVYGTTSFVIHDLTYSEIKFRYGLNVSGMFNEQFLLEDEVQVLSNCRFKMFI